jgi:C4-dicarboxylate-specific signal transduction histidine kinase
VKPLEEQLNSVIVGLLMASAVVRRQREEREEAERRWREEEKGRLEQAEAERKEAHRRRELLDLVARWRETGEIRAYVKAVRSLASHTQYKVNVDRLEGLAKWASAIADDLDPLITGDPIPAEGFVK